METSDFYKTWEALNEERQSLAVRRDEIELELSEIRVKLQHLDKVLEHLLPLADLSMFVCEINHLGLTDAIRTILQMKKDERFSAADVHTKLQDEGYDLSSLTAPMASIYKILSRLAEKPEEVRREKEEDGRVYYTWVADFPPF
jgi:hypothetical protein